jgi:hypothetical protein
MATMYLKHFKITGQLAPFHDLVGFELMRHSVSALNRIYRERANHVRD